MSKDREEREGKGFTVSDHRHFEADGAERDGLGKEPASSPPPATLLEIDFSTFILSLVTSAMVHLGEAPHPDGEVRKELPLAKQTIDILAMLREKTSGNLTDEEQMLVDELLYDLRLRYVAAAR